MRLNKSTATTEENYLQNCKNADMVNLYIKLKTSAFKNLNNVKIAATAQYISWSIDGGRQFAELFIQKKKILILTLEPIGKYNLGKNVPETHMWTLNYKTDIFSDDDIKEAKKIICESYNRLI